jgi:hypothetical protein
VARGKNITRFFASGSGPGEIYPKESRIDGGFMTAAVLFRERKAASRGAREAKGRRLFQQNSEGVGLQVFLAPGRELACQLDNVVACMN